jgi:tRNA (guanosine-2'-O-)-methyltransferase|tara:strand:+ start:44515 stop:45198 length:684 start_codon:yes stop_codon:yes gene_type:complete
MNIDSLVLDEFHKIISPNKIELFDSIASLRTDYMTVVLENIYQEHNASAVLRTCDCFGVQTLHAIEKNNKYMVQRDIARGAGRWVDLKNYSTPNPTKDCLTKLKNDGYTIIATTPHENEKKMTEIPLDKPIALVFGTEGEGISQEVVNMADHFVKIPMYGFTESYNVSVSVALTLQFLRNRLENENVPFLMNEEEQTKLKIKWCTKIIREGSKIEEEIRKRILEIRK